MRHEAHSFFQIAAGYSPLGLYFPCRRMTFFTVNTDTSDVKYKYLEGHVSAGHAENVSFPHRKSIMLLASSEGINLFSFSVSRYEYVSHNPGLLIFLSHLF